MAVIRKKVKRNVMDLDASHSNAENIRELAFRAGVETNPLDIEGLVRALGIKLEYKSLEDDISGHLQQKSDGKWLITINALHHPNRRRFTIAHELGHYFLHGKKHSDFVDKILFRSTDSDPQEREANSFAAELLMPLDQFKGYINQGVTKVEQLAQKFNVSAMAVRVRAKELGYKGHGL
jgi:Zn-dependent peptidase ImmA (M78 family)